MHPPYRLIFFGTPRFALPSLHHLASNKSFQVSVVVTQPDMPKGRSKMPFPTDIKKAAVELSIPIITPHSLKDQKKNIEQYGPYDVGVVVAYGVILPSWLLTIPKMGIINVHPSLLPRLRGPSPLQTAIVSGEKVTGISFILLDTKMDHGPIISQEELVIEDDDTYSSLSDRSSKLAGKILPRIISSYLEKSLIPIEQKHTNATFSKMLKKDDGHIHFNHTVQEIYDSIRGLNPWPGTYTMWKGKKLKVLEARPHSHAKTTEPGRVLSDRKEIIVETANGTIAILRLQLEGKKPLSYQNFLNGHPDIEGSLLS